MNATEISSLQIVTEQILNLYLVKDKISNIKDVSQLNIGEYEIGERTGKFTQITYSDLYKEMLFEKKYHLLLNDESIISFYYLFDKDKKIIKHNLSFIPSLDIDIILSEELTTENRIAVLQNTNNYIRVDFDSKGKKEIVHTDVHMHYGIFHTEYEREYSELRLPLEGEIYPFEFIYIILKYVYESNSSELDFLLHPKYKKKHRLEKNELDKLILTFNRDSYSL